MDTDKAQRVAEYIEQHADVIREALRRARVVRPWICIGRGLEMRGELMALDTTRIAEVRWDGEVFVCDDPPVRVGPVYSDDEGEEDSFTDVEAVAFWRCIELVNAALRERGWVLLEAEVANPCPRCKRDVMHRPGQMCTNCKAGRHVWGLGPCRICGLYRKAGRRGDPLLYSTDPNGPWGPMQPCKPAEAP